MSDYPVYYDAIYYPSKHMNVFASPQNFCDWLVKALKNHHLHCTCCDFPFIGSVAFNTAALDIFYAPLCVSLPKNVEYFASVDYMHCRLLHELRDLMACPVDSQALVVNSVVHGPACWSRIICYGTAYLICTYRSRIARISLFVCYHE